MARAPDALAQPRLRSAHRRAAPQGKLRRRRARRLRRLLAAGAWRLRRAHRLRRADPERPLAAPRAAAARDAGHAPADRCRNPPQSRAAHELRGRAAGQPARGGRPHRDRRRRPPAGDAWRRRSPPASASGGASMRFRPCSMRPRCAPICARRSGRPDLERALSRLSLGRGGPRDLHAMREGLRERPRSRRAWRMTTARSPRAPAGSRISLTWRAGSTTPWWTARRFSRATAD